ncbi:MAG: ABC transporter permease [Gemmatimonadetes bacterium]|nr:ABC transporter permease [Gemmatimonadota bacterium]
MLLTAARIGADALRINPLRTALSTLGMIIGVASLVAVLSLGDGMERTAREQLQSTSPIQAIGISSRMVETVDGDAFSRPDTMGLTTGMWDALRELPGVASASIMVQARAQARLDTVRRLVTLRGMRGASPPTPPLRAGRALAPADSASPVLVASWTLARRLRPGQPDSLVGRWLSIGDDSLLIVGVHAAAPGPPAATAEVPYTVAERMAAARGAAFPSIQLLAASIEEVAPLQERIDAWFDTNAREHGGRRAVTVETYRARAEQAAQGILVFKLLMGAITGISLLVGGIGIMNVLLASVSERTREIGLRRAAGATRRDILWQFLAESVAISAFGATVGIVVGLVGSFGITALIRRFAQAAFIQASFSVGSLAAAAAASLLVGLAFGTWPARRASLLDPIDAIRHE